MTSLLFLVPVALALGAAGLAAFLWALRSGQYDDLDGAGSRILFDDDRAGGAVPNQVVANQAVPNQAVTNQGETRCPPSPPSSPAR